MPLFSYKGFDQYGAEEAGTIDAAQEQLAYLTLKSRGITVVELHKGGELPSGLNVPWYKRDLQFGSGRLPLSEQANLASLLATLFGAGLTAAEVCRTASRSVGNQHLARFFLRIGARLEEGQSFSDAFEAENRFFAPVVVAFLHVSDASNEISALLQSVSELLARQNEIRQKVISALIYPSILVVAAIALVLTIVMYLAPNLAPVFNAAGQEPSGTIAILLRLNQFLSTNWLFVLVGISASFLSILLLLQSAATKSALANFVYRAPIMGPLILKSKLARTTHAVALLMNSGYPLADALRTAGQRMAPSTHVGARFEEAAEVIETGGRAAEVFSTDMRIPPTFQELFRIGENANTLPETLTSLSKALNEDVERHALRLTTLLTPVMTLILGLGVGYLVYTVLGAVLDVNDLAF